MKSFKRLINEYDILRNNKLHPNILKTFGAFLSDENTPPSILLEFCPSNLHQAILDKSLSKVKIAIYIYEIAEGMRYLHFNKIIHRDLKPSNVLIDQNGIIKISDFCMSKLMDPNYQSMSSGIGTPKFSAPEIINEEKHYDEKVDVYSFGVLLYFLLSEGKMPNITIPQIATGKKAKIPIEFTDLSRKLINACWNFHSKDRPSFKTICNNILKTKYDLFPFNESESNEVHRCMNEHKSLIPDYSE